MINFSSMVNLIIFFNFVMSIIFLYFSYKFPDLYVLKILKFAFEASLVGAIADSYAVFGLFYKIGPHTQIIINKKSELIEKVKLFVGEFLFEKDFLEKELSGVDVEILKISDIKKLKDKLIPSILKKAKKYKIANSLINIILSELIDKVIELVILKFNQQINNKGKDIIKNVIIENHDVILELIDKRLKSIEDKEFVDIIKNSCWDELQWIRLNGCLLGWIIGVFIGIFNILAKGSL